MLALPTQRSRRRDRRTVRNVPSAPERRHDVTVVITSYNYARYLEAAAMSALTQRDVDVRLLIVDDCSSDGTAEVTARLSEDPRVSVITHVANLGHIPSVNEAFSLVESEFTVKLDADDLLAPGALARSVALLESDPGIAFVYGRPLHFEGSPPPIDDDDTASWSIWKGATWLGRRCADATCVISQPEVVTRTSFLRRALPVREDLPHTSDVHFWLQLAALGDVGRINGPVQGLYRVHDQSMQRTVHSGALFDLEGRRDAYAAAFAGPAGDLVGAEELHATARRRLAVLSLDLACRAYDRGRTDSQPVDAYRSFALEVWPESASLPAWRALERRRELGPDRAARRPRAYIDAAGRRAGDSFSRWRWQRTGEW